MQQYLFECTLSRLSIINCSIKNIYFQDYNLLIMDFVQSTDQSETSTFYVAYIHTHYG